MCSSSNRYSLPPSLAADELKDTDIQLLLHTLYYELTLGLTTIDNFYTSVLLITQMYVYSMYIDGAMRVGVSGTLAVWRG